MNVTYTPPLHEQIRTQRRAREQAAGQLVRVRVKGRFVERIDPVTRRATGEPQPFRVTSEGRLTILSQREFGADPTVIDVDRMDFG